MPSVTLTNHFVNQLSSSNPDARIKLYFDTEIKGFLLEHRLGGGMTYYFRYRDVDKKVRLERLGKASEISLDEARQRAYEVRKIVREGGNPKIELHQFHHIPTFGKFVLDTFMPYVSVHKRSAWMDDSLLRNHILPFLKDLRLDRIKQRHIIELQSYALQQGYAPGTCNRWLVLVRYVFNCAIRWGVLPPGNNPSHGVAFVEDKGGRERFLTADEVQRLFAVLQRYPNPQLNNIIKLLLLTGARKREILDARWEHIDLEHRTLKVPVSKSGKPRFIALSDAAVEILNSIERKHDIPWVFYNPKTLKPIVSFFAAWNTIRRAAQIPDVRVHDLRHSFASFLVMSGRSLYEVQKLLGHYDPKITMRYAHLSQQALIDAANVVSQLFDSFDAQSSDV